MRDMLRLLLCSFYALFQSSAGFGCDQFQHSRNVIDDLEKSNLVTPTERHSWRTQFNQTFMDTVNTLPDTCTEEQPIRSDCQTDMCYHLLYRTMDGTCNNFRNPEWGAAYSMLRRLRQPVYDDGVMMPIGTVEKRRRPSSRDASRFLLSAEKEIYDDRYNEMLMLWGQFLAHDISKTSKTAFNQSCLFCFPDDGSHCIAMKVPLDDPGSREFGCHFSSHPSVTPIKFLPKLICCIISTRSTPICGTGEVTPREQLNENTAFIDGSQIYGSSNADLEKLRDGRTAFMKTSTIHGKTYMPYNTSSEICNSTSCQYNFFGGDPRNDLFVGLACLHTVFLREHNRLVREFKKINSHWNDDRLFQEARKVVGAVLQYITYEEYLPRILGQNEYRNRIGNYKGYDPNTNAGIFNVFATSTLRFGHGMIRSHFLRFRNDGVEYSGRGYNVLDAVFNSTKIVEEGGIDPYLNGIMLAEVKQPRGVAKQLTRRLFGNTDLTAVNIERGREHGLPGYNTWRKYCRLRDARTFADLADDIPIEETRRVLELMYLDTDNIDLYVGQLLEQPIPGGIVGPTIACILAEQMRDIRDGDRLFYENSGVFTTDQLIEIKKTSLSRLFCDNSDGMTLVPGGSFDFKQFADFKDCASVPGIDLQKWTE